MRNKTRQDLETFIARKGVSTLLSTPEGRELLAFAQSVQMVCDIANREILAHNGGYARHRLQELRERADSVVAKATNKAPEPQFAG